MLAYRFEGDRFCRAQRFAAYSRGTRRSLHGAGAAGQAANADSAPFFANVPSPHSVVTAHLIDEAGQPTIAARDEILAFFKHRLGAAARRPQLIAYRAPRATAA